ncbi:hypothetical protein HDC93_001733 [Streptomyces sp. AK010]|nr:hypothetical protein [Streptomyces sp. AK010]
MDEVARLEITVHEPPDHETDEVISVRVVWSRRWTFSRGRGRAPRFRSARRGAVEAPSRPGRVLASRRAAHTGVCAVAGGGPFHEPGSAGSRNEPGSAGFVVDRRPGMRHEPDRRSEPDGHRVLEGRLPRPADTGRGWAPGQSCARLRPGSRIAGCAVGAVSSARRGTGRARLPEGWGPFLHGHAGGVARVRRVRVHRGGRYGSSPPRGGPFAEPTEPVPPQASRCGRSGRRPYGRRAASSAGG